jgi:AcrR family transcriptional regulator
MASVKRPYDNSRRQAQSRATYLRIVATAKDLFIRNGYPATTLEAVAEAADTSLPTLYRLFASKRALLKAVLDTSFGGDDQPIAFGDRSDVMAARYQPDPESLIRAFARIARDFMARSSAIMHVLSTAAQVDPEIAELMEEIRRQRREGQSRIVAALSDLAALDPNLDRSEAVDIIYVALSPDVHRMLTVERDWTADQYEQWIIRSLKMLVRQ